jgi:hypothetical protein
VVRSLRRLVVEMTHKGRHETPLPRTAALARRLSSHQQLELKNPMDLCLARLGEWGSSAVPLGKLFYFNYHNPNETMALSVQNHGREHVSFDRG